MDLVKVGGVGNGLRDSVGKDTNIYRIPTMCYVLIGCFYMHYFI